MMEKNIVSLIVPCYNGETFLNQCLDSILAQSYKLIELIIVNDGSNDRSDEIIKKRMAEIESILWKFKYICQKNAGVGAAVNAALKYVTGEYLALLDVDDYMMPQAMEMKVKWMKKHPDYDAVFNNGYYVHEKTYYVDKDKFYPENYTWNEDAFEQIITGKIVNWPASYMVRMNAWLRRCPDREIFPSRNGQNMQIILPAVYKARAGYIDVPLMRYLINEESLSHFKNDDQGKKQLEASKKYQEIYVNVVNSICDKEEIQAIQKVINEMFERSRFQLAIKVHNTEVMRENYLLLKENDRVLLDDMIDYYNICNPIVGICLRGIRRVRMLWNKA